MPAQTVYISLMKIEKGHEPMSQVELKNAPSDLFDNMVAWNIFNDDQNWKRFDATLNEAKNVLAERGSVCIQLKPHANNNGDILKVFEDCDDEYLSYLLQSAMQTAKMNIARDKTMHGVTVISKPVETYSPELGRNYMLCLYLAKNKHTVN